MIRKIPVGKEKRLPDLINAAPKTNFTMVPNAILRNPEMSAVAKSILMLTLSNKEGWTSYTNVIGTMMKEGKFARENGIRELEQLGFLRRIYYCDPKTKLLTGSFWCVSSTAGDFDEEAIEQRLEKQHVLRCNKPGPDRPQADVREMGHSSPGQRTIGDQPLKRPIEKRPKENIKKGFFDTLEDFLFLFPIAWQKDPEFNAAAAEYFHHRELQPKGFSQLAGKQASNKLKRFTMEVATAALLEAVEKKWTGVFPESIQGGAPAKETLPKASKCCRPEDIIAKAFPNRYSQDRFLKYCFHPAVRTMAGSDPKQNMQLARNLITLYQHIADQQSKTRDNDHRWEPIKIIQYYVDWIDEQDWITSKGAYLFAPGATVFDRQFRTEMAELHTYWHDIITGFTIS